MKIAQSTKLALGLFGWWQCWAGLRTCFLEANDPELLCDELLPWLKIHTKLSPNAEFSLVSGNVFLRDFIVSSKRNKAII
jgi:hypothetical protein